MLGRTLPGAAVGRSATSIRAAPANTVEAAILDKQVTYDFARLMEGANEISTSAFGRAMIDRM